MVACKIVSNWNLMNAEERDIFVREKFDTYRSLGFCVMRYNKLSVISLDDEALVWSGGNYHEIATIVKFEKYLDKKLNEGN